MDGSFRNQDSDILAEEMESWRYFAVSVNSEQYKRLFDRMLNDSHKYATAIGVKQELPFSTEPLITALLQSEYKMINWLKERISEIKVKQVDSTLKF
jgi:hypothetical protein